MNFLESHIRLGSLNIEKIVGEKGSTMVEKERLCVNYALKNNTMAMDVYT